MSQCNTHAPCKGCPGRYPGCSAHCDKPGYLAWRAEMETIRKNKKNYVPPIWVRDEADKSIF